jgi:ABC-2 type transport system ATP-binding protein
MNALEVEGLDKSYSKGFIPRKVEVLNQVSFHVPAGTITGFLGANGSGKTTTMRCVLGLDFADRGQVRFFGAPLDVETKRRIGFLPEQPYFYEHLTGIEFLSFYAQLTKAWSRPVLKSRISELLRRVDLEFAKDRRLRNYSKGMLQKIGVAQALIHEPELVILDEPMSGLDPDGRLALSEIIRRTAQDGTAVFFSSHLLHDTEKLCERLVVLKNGGVIYEGGTQELLNRSAAGFEIFYRKGETQTIVQASTPAELQRQLQAIMADRGEILEVRPKRASLEEIFVDMALPEGRRR